MSSGSDIHTFKRRDKGKGRAASSAAELFLQDDEDRNGDLEENDAGGSSSGARINAHSRHTPDYEAALGDVLGERSESGQDHDREGAAQKREQDDDEEPFTYDGRDDDDFNELREQAQELSKTTDREKLQGVLEDDYPDDEHGPLSLSSRNGTSSFSPIPADEQPTFSHSPSPSTTHTSTFSPSPLASPAFDSQTPFRKPRLSSSSSMGGSIPYPRRPPMNPLVSRLRSTSGAPSLTPSQSRRSFSNASSTGDPRYSFRENGFANDSFIGSAVFQPDGDAGTASRRSSTSNLHEQSMLGELKGYERGISRSASDIFASPFSTSPAQSVKDVKRPKKPPETSPFSWAILRKLSNRFFASSSTHTPNKASTGEPTAFVASGIICIGTSKGWALVFDLSQTLLCVCGNENVLKTSGAVSALAISSDQTYIAVGHTSGFIYLYNLQKPSQPARVVPPVSLSSVNQGKAEGHLQGSCRITHLGFVGNRHTAIVSADSEGLAFYYSLGKVLGLANTDVLRILGKYPVQDAVPAKINGINGHPHDNPMTAATALLSMQPLPLGTAAHPTDEYSIVALLTGVKLVIAGLKPTARTWWRCMNRGPAAGRADSSASTNTQARQAGTTAWLPTIAGQDPLLAFSWGKEVRIVKVGQEVRSASTVKATSGSTAQVNGKMPTNGAGLAKSLSFTPLGSHSQKDDRETASVYKAESDVLAMQWLNQQSLLILTETHLEIFDSQTLARTERISLDTHSLTLPKTIHVEQALRTYRGKLFLLTATDIRAGSVLSWADRVLSLVDSGELVQAIELTLAYFNGTAITSAETSASLLHNLALPADGEARKAVVEPKLRNILLASMQYVFSGDRMRDDTHSAGNGRGVDRTSLFEDLVDASANACLAIDQYDFLWEDLYERYSSEGIESIFLDRIEPFIVQGSIKSVPTAVVQEILKGHEEKGELQQAEDLIWHVSPECLDVNQAVSICSRHRLFDALIYVYTRALNDYVGPLVELLGVIRRIRKERRMRPRWVGGEAGDSSTVQLDDDDFFDDMETVEGLVPDAYKVYSYLADSLVGLTHPSKEPLPEPAALEAKLALYSFLFSGRSRAYPEGAGNTALVLTTDEEGAAEPTYPYLRLLLRFDAEAMLGCLDVALEDPYLNEEAAGRTLDRQQIINLLLDVMRSPTASSTTSDMFSAADRTFLNIFVARNLPKYSQFVQLAPPTLDNLLRELATDPDESTREDRQLAAEYLLSAYSPTYDEDFLALLDRAGFFRVLASIYSLKHRWAQLVSVYVRDPEQGDSVFEQLPRVLQEAAKTFEDREATCKEVLDAIPRLVMTSVMDTAALVDEFFPEQHERALEKLGGTPLRQMAYLRALLEPDTIEQEDDKPLCGPSSRASHRCRLQYLSLLCDLDSQGIVRYLGKDKVLSRDAAVEVCQEKGAYEAVVWAHAQAGRLEKALTTTAEVLQSCSELITAGMLDHGSDVSKSSRQVMNTARMAISVCLQYSGQPSDVEAEDMWYSLLSTLVELVRATNIATTAGAESSVPSDIAEIQFLIPEALSALISSTSSHSFSFPSLVRRLMEVTSPASYSEYRSIVDSMLDTYRFEEDLLSTSTRLTKADLFEDISRLRKERGIGWRPNPSGLCEACGKPMLAAQKAGSKYDDLNLIPKSASGLEVSERLRARPAVRRRPSLKGKETDWYEEEPVANQRGRNYGRSIVVFRGGAACHAACLEKGQA